MTIFQALSLFCVFLLFCQLGSCGALLCPGTGFSFSGSCFQFVEQRMDFWGARRSCLACGGHLANISDDVLASLAQQINESSSWWVEQDSVGEIYLLLCAI